MKRHRTTHKLRRRSKTKMKAMNTNKRSRKRRTKRRPRGFSKIGGSISDEVASQGGEDSDLWKRLSALRSSVNTVNDDAAGNDDLEQRFSALRSSVNTEDADITNEDSTSNAIQARALGNDAFKRGDYAGAIKLYNIAIEYSDDPEFVHGCQDNLSMAIVKDASAQPATESIQSGENKKGVSRAMSTAARRVRETKAMEAAKITAQAKADEAEKATKADNALKVSKKAKKAKKAPKAAQERVERQIKLEKESQRKEIIKGRRTPRNTPRTARKRPEGSGDIYIPSSMGDPDMRPPSTTPLVVSTLDLAPQSPISGVYSPTIASGSDSDSEYLSECNEKRAKLQLLNDTVMQSLRECNADISMNNEWRPKMRAELDILSTENDKLKSENASITGQLDVLNDQLSGKW